MNPFSASALFLRRRSVWEAVDSGVLLWRGSFVHLVPYFVLPVIIAACGLRFLSGDSILLPFLVLWWLKPFFDRLVLHVVSVRFFAGGESSSRFRELRGGLWAARRGLWGDLLWRRFSPWRAACMPIRVLERVGGDQFHARKKALASGGLNFCSFLSFICLSLEIFLLISKIVFTVVITLTFFPAGLNHVWNISEITLTLIFAAFCFNYILVGSLYVCMGFGLYINSRVEVEGWDLQLLFQKFAGNSATSTIPVPEIKRGITAFSLFLLLALPQAAYSDSPPPDEARFSFMEGLPSPDTRSLEALESILASPDFGGFREGWGLRFRERERVERAPLPEIDVAPWLERVRQVFGYVLRGIAALAIAAFSLFALYWYWKNRQKGMFLFRSEGKNYINPLFSPESPQALFARAEDFFGRGNSREAWAACLAGCIASYRKYHSLSFPADATEHDCLALLRQSLPAEAEGFDALARNWILFAYGGRPPGKRAFEQALSYGHSLLTRSRSNDETQ